MNVALVVPELPSVTVTSSTESVGVGSSSVIVPSPSPSTIVPLIGFESVTVSVSASSSNRSSRTGTSKCPVSSAPGEIDRAGDRGVVVTRGGRPVRRRIGRRERQLAVPASADGEPEGSRRPRPWRRHRRSRPSTEDRRRGSCRHLGRRRSRPRPVAQVQEERFVELVDVAAVDGHRHGPRGLRGEEGERAAGGGVVDSGGGEPLRSTWRCRPPSRNQPRRRGRSPRKASR